MSYPGYDYPEDDDLERIEKWRIEWLNDGKHPVYGPWFDAIKALWWMPEWGWTEEDGSDDLHERPVRIYSISTGGWSGNESLIGAMERNFICWSQTFVQMRRGGHYVFYAPRLTTPSECSPSPEKNA
jgi:hypothetical protein